MFKLLHEARDARRLRRASRIRPTRSAGSGTRVAAGGARSSRRPRGCSPSAPARTSSACAAMSSACCSTRWARRRSPLDDVREIAGPAALQDDWAMTNAIEAGRRRECAAPARADARRGRAAGENPGTARLAGADEVSDASRRRALRPAVEALFRTDLDLKRSAGDPRVLLERLVVELCAGSAARRGDGQAR